LDRRTAVTHHDLKTTLTSIILIECPLSHLYTEVLYYYEFGLALLTMVGSTPSNVFATPPKLRAHCISLDTRDLDAAGYDLPRDRALACNLKLIVIAYLLTCRSFLLYIYNFSFSDIAS